MPRAEHSADIGEIFRQHSIIFLKQLGYDILGTKFPIKCVNVGYHKVNDHTIDILGNHVHTFEPPFSRKAIVIESKSTLPNLVDIHDTVSGLADKIDCLARNHPNFSTNEGLVISRDNPSLGKIEEFKKAIVKTAGERFIYIGLLAGAKFRTLEAMSKCRYNYRNQELSVSTFLPDRSPEKDVGAVCPINLDINKLFVCGTKFGCLKLQVFKICTESYNSDELIEDLAVASKFGGTLEQIHSSAGYVDDVATNLSVMGNRPVLINHDLEQTLFGDYLGYTRTQ